MHTDVITVTTHPNLDLDNIILKSSTHNFIGTAFQTSEGLWTHELRSYLK